MSDNKKYYYIKLKDNYFEQDNIKILEAQENGYIYSLIILKLYIKSAKHDGLLMMTDRIPYDPKKLEVLSRVLNHDIAHVKDALTHAVELDLITILDSGEIWMTEIQNFLGHSSSEADRKREYRKKLDNGQMSRQLSDDRPPEIEKELEKERKREIDYTSIDTIIDYFNKITGQKRRYSKTSRTPIHARLQDSYTVEDCKKVIDTKYNEWKDNEDMEKYITIETFFRPGNFEKYLNQQNGETEDPEKRKRLDAYMTKAFKDNL